MITGAPTFEANHEKRTRELRHALKTEGHGMSAGATTFETYHKKLTRELKHSSRTLRPRDRAWKLRLPNQIGEQNAHRKR